MVPDRHWWRTADGELVPDGHEAALFLAYPKGIEVPDHLAEQIGLAQAVRAFAAPKATPRPADKMVHKPDDK